LLSSPSGYGLPLGLLPDFNVATYSGVNRATYQQQPLLVSAEEIRDEIHAFFGCTIANTLRPVLSRRALSILCRSMSRRKLFAVLRFLPEINDGLTNQIIQWTG